MRRRSPTALPREELFQAIRATARGDSVLSPAVKTHLPHIFAKPGVDDRAAAVTAALEKGVLRLAK